MANVLPATLKEVTIMEAYGGFGYSLSLKAIATISSMVVPGTFATDIVV